MKIGIVTYWNSSDNYGQLLQCYALQTLLRSWGHDAYLIRYAPEMRQETIILKIIKHLKHPKYILNHLPIRTERKKDVDLERCLKKENALKNVERCFELFREEHLQMTKQIYTSFSELEDNPPEAEVYIVGSDQVWHNSYNEEAIKGWFLQFGSKKTKRISYAASFGRELKTNEMTALKRFLFIFDAIGVRENFARELCLKAGFQAVVTLDPTLLLPIENYRSLMQKFKSFSRFVFIYILNVKTSDDIHWYDINAYLEKEGLIPRFVYSSGYYQARQIVEGSVGILATIPEWLGLVACAECVFTTSFHGTVFAILMHRPFLTILLTNKKANGNNRMQDLLISLGLASRIYNPLLSVKEQMERHIEWDVVDSKIEKYRTSSIQFLKDNLID